MVEIEMTAEDAQEMFKVNWIQILLLIGVVLIFVSGALAYYEFSEAKRFCKSIEGEYSLDFFPLPPSHFCDNKPLIQYNDGWDFERIEVKPLIDITKIK